MPSNPNRAKLLKKPRNWVHSVQAQVLSDVFNLLFTKVLSAFKTLALAWSII